MELDRSRPAHRRQLDALGHIPGGWRLQLVAIPHELDETCSGSEAIRMLLVELRKETLPPEPGRDAVELLDWLELPLDDAPIVILTGFNEGFLPESVSGPRLLARRTSVSPRPPRQFEAGCHVMRTVSRTVLHSKKSVRVIAGRRTSQGDPLRPSRLMFRIPEEQMPARVIHFLERDGGGERGTSLASLGLEPGARSQFTVPPEEMIELGEDAIPTGPGGHRVQGSLEGPVPIRLGEGVRPQPPGRHCA